MENNYTIEEPKPFADSLIWELNREYYKKEGVNAWRNGDVPHYLTSNSNVGNTYAELIFGFLRDIASSNKGQEKQEKVYILELGAGHGRLAFHILKHLENLIEQTPYDLPDYCYVLSDIAEDNLHFFEHHEQFQPYLESGVLDVAYFDGVGSETIDLRYAKKSIQKSGLKQPLIVLANYFFDSIPNDLFLVYDQKMYSSTVSLSSAVDPNTLERSDLLEHIQTNYHQREISFPYYKDEELDSILSFYQESLKRSYLFFPKMGIQCIQNLQKLSDKGLMVIAMDKGHHEIHELEGTVEPKMVGHGSFSFNVNFHAFNEYCKSHGGKTLFPTFSNFDIQVGCMLFLENKDNYIETELAYRRFVNDFGPDDLNGLKKFILKRINDLELVEIIGLLRLNRYDSTIFKHLLPRIKQVAQTITINERTRLAQTLSEVWNMYFNLYEPEDLAFEIGGLYLMLGYYKTALTHFDYSLRVFGKTADVFYNKAICHYQLREDQAFLQVVKEAKTAFPDFEAFQKLDQLDLNAK